MARNNKYICFSPYIFKDMKIMKLSLHVKAGRIDYNSEEMRSYLKNIIDNGLNKQLRSEYRRVASVANKRIARDTV